MMEFSQFRGVHRQTADRVSVVKKKTLAGKTIFPLKTTTIAQKLIKDQRGKYFGDRKQNNHHAPANPPNKITPMTKNKQENIYLSGVLF